MRARSIGSLVAAAVLLAASVGVQASVDVDFAGRGVSNPSLETYRTSLLSVSLSQQVLSSLMIHAADEAVQQPAQPWFSQPVVFGEYSYDSTRERIGAGGYKNRTSSFTAGISGLTKGDYAVGMLLDFARTNGDNDLGAEQQQDAVTLTAFVAKNLNDWLFCGASVAYNYSETRVSSPATVDAEGSGVVLSPFIGAVYTNGAWTAISTPTLIYRHVEMNYSNATADDNSDDTTFVWANELKYAFNDKLSGSIICNWNSVMAFSPVVGGKGIPTDRNWVTLGGKVAYQLTDAINVYAGVSSAVWNSYAEEYTGNVGVEVRF